MPVKWYSVLRLQTAAESIHAVVRSHNLRRRSAVGGNMTIHFSIASPTQSRPIWGSPRAPISLPHPWWMIYKSATTGNFQRLTQRVRRLRLRGDLRSDQWKTERMARLATWILIPISGGLIAACSASSVSNSSISVPDSTCSLTFDLHSLSSPAAITPAQAVADFIQHGSIAQPGFGVRNPVREGFPSVGWKQSNGSENSATFRSGGVRFN